ncbi:MAG: hypothetical protein E3J23_08500 [Candidatus Stahlbacteria bacterium]|nr:MAG: hypothetical protein E3J23_08500 [Candidatus Stahlbacteria bacterium]
MIEIDRNILRAARQSGKSKMFGELINYEIRKRLTVTEREKFDFFIIKAELYYERGCCCERCNTPLNLHGFELAHRIGQGAISLYGKKIIHHKLNLKIVCQSKDCNDFFNIGNKPGQVKALVAEIKEVIEGE